MVKTDLVFCKPPKFPPVESGGVGESGAVSQKQTNGFEHGTPTGNTEWLATTFTLKMPLVIAVKYSRSFVSELCPLAVICLSC